MAKEEIKYEDAERLKKAQKLMKLCRDKLTKADQEVKKILDDGRV